MLKSMFEKSGLCLRGFLAAVITVLQVSGIVAATSAEIKEIRTENFENKVRVIVELEDEIEFTFFTLSEPNRIVLDLKNASSRIDFGKLQAIKPVKRLRSALRENGSLRIVLDVNGDVAASRAFGAESRGGDFDLIVDIPKSKAILETD